MKHQFNVSGSLSLVLIPETPLEKELLKSLSSQENAFVETSKGSSSGALYNEGTIIVGPKA